jgi:hypothetical protein
MQKQEEKLLWCCLEITRTLNIFQRFLFKGLYKHQHRTINNMNNSVEMWCSMNQVFEVWLLEVASKISAFFIK